MEVDLLAVVQKFPLEPSNIPPFFTFDVTHLSQSVRLNDAAPLNIFSILVTLETSHLETSPLNDDAEANMRSMSVTFDTFHLERSPLNVDADLNMYAMVVAFDTSHLERSPLNLSETFCASNKFFISVTVETSQDPIGPFEPLVQSKSDAFRHPAMAYWSSALDLGVKAGGVCIFNGVTWMFS